MVSGSEHWFGLRRPGATPARTSRAGARARTILNPSPGEQGRGRLPVRLRVFQMVPDALEDFLQTPQTNPAVIHRDNREAMQGKGGFYSVAQFVLGQRRFDMEPNGGAIEVR